MRRLSNYVALAGDGQLHRTAPGGKNRRTLCALRVSALVHDRYEALRCASCFPPERREAAGGR